MMNRRRAITLLGTAPFAAKAVIALPAPVNTQRQYIVGFDMPAGALVSLSGSWRPLKNTVAAEPTVPRWVQVHRLEDLQGPPVWQSPVGYAFRYSAPFSEAFRSRLGFHITCNNPAIVFDALVGIVTPGGGMVVHSYWGRGAADPEKHALTRAS